MAQDLLSGKNIPVYFYGQQYGFSFFEVVTTSLGILLFGNTVWALKFGGMLVFSLGIFFLLKICIKKNISFLISLAIIFIVCCFPPWLLWATKPRGGYITAFTCSCILIYIFQLYKPNFKNVILASLIVAVGIHAQVLIIIPVSIYFAGWLLAEKKGLLIFYTAKLMIVFLFLLKLPAYINQPYWKVPLKAEFHFNYFIEIISHLPSLINGAFYYEQAFAPGSFLIVGSFIYLLIAIVVLVPGIKSTNGKAKKSILYLLLGSVISFIFIGFMSGGIYRYSLGFFTGGLLVLFVGLVKFVLKKNKRYKIFIVGFMLVCISCSWGVKNIPSFWQQPHANDMVMYNELPQHLKSINTQHVFVMDPMMQWMLNYSGLKARSTSVTERVNTYSKQVTECYAQPLCNTALIGLVGYFEFNDPTDPLNDWNEKVVIVNQRFFVYPNPQPRHLKAAGFE